MSLEKTRIMKKNNNKNGFRVTSIADLGGSLE